ncbi:hypothetical protein CEXT_4001 [Caerostris extrusa]|uniref:Secreted protein n=1 Tax=Caerostris extrusa TaxID=172846 RepID=A0AAV4QRC3_CAEEX|nr:hypothetical protein CEXT_4001 [Caerostris extrusa]
MQEFVFFVSITFVNAAHTFLVMCESLSFNLLNDPFSVTGSLNTRERPFQCLIFTTFFSLNSLLQEHQNSCKTSF